MAKSSVTQSETCHVCRKIISFDNPWWETNARRDSSLKFKFSDTCNPLFLTWFHGYLAHLHEISGRRSQSFWWSFDHNNRWKNLIVMIKFRLLSCGFSTELCESCEDWTSRLFCHSVAPFLSLEKALKTPFYQGWMLSEKLLMDFTAPCWYPHRAMTVTDPSAPHAPLHCHVQVRLPTLSSGFTVALIAVALIIRAENNFLPPLLNIRFRNQLLSDV